MNNQSIKIYGKLGTQLIAQQDIRQFQQQSHSPQKSDLNLSDPMTYVRVKFQPPYQFQSKFNSNAINTNFTEILGGVQVPELTLENRVLGECMDLKAQYQARNIGMEQSKNQKYKPNQQQKQKQHNLKVSRYQLAQKQRTTVQDQDVERFAKEHNLNKVRAKNFLDMYGGSYQLAHEGYQELYKQ